MLTIEDLKNIRTILYRYNKSNDDYESRTMLKKLDEEIDERYNSFEFLDSPEIWEEICVFMKEKKTDHIEQLNKGLVKSSIMNANDYNWKTFNGTFDPKNYYYRIREYTEKELGL